MTLFGSRRLITTYATASHLMESDANLIQDAVLYSVLKKQPLSKTLTDSFLQSIGSKVDAALSYAKNHYTLGLPDYDHGSTNRASDAAIALAVDAEFSLSYGSVIEFNYIAPMSALTATLPYLLETREYNTYNGAIGNPPSAWADSLPTRMSGTETRPIMPTSKHFYVYDAVLNFNNTSVTLYYNCVITYMQENRDHDFTQITVATSTYQDTYSEVINLPSAIQLGRPYYVVGYKIKDSGGAASEEIYWWFYSIDTGKYPALDPNLGGADQSNSYPVVPVRFNTVSLGPTHLPDIYNTGKKLLKRMGIDFDDIVTAIDANPDVGYIDHAYVMMGADVQSENQVVLKYLATFFNHLASTDDVTIFDVTRGNKDYNAFSFGSGPSDPGYTTTTDGKVTTINPTDPISLTEHGLNVSITYDAITSVTVVGSVGAVGTVTKVITPSIPGNEQSKPVLTLYEQVATNTYREVRVINLVHTNMIYNNHGVTTTLDAVDASEDEHNMIIPLHREAAREIGLDNRNILYQECMILQMNSYDITRLKWYQTDAFTVLFMALAITIAVTTGQPWVAGLASAATAGAGALILYLLQTAVIAAAAHYAAVAVAKKYGPEITIVVAMIAMAISVGARQTAFTFLGATIPTAEAFLFIGSVLIEASNTAMNALIKDSEAKYSDFMLDAEAQTEILEAAEELLDVEYNLPFSYLEPPKYPVPEVYTEPDLMYAKIHTGNIGTLSLNVVENYVDMSLSLPETKDNEK